jgi:hypothetical protein
MASYTQVFSLKEAMMNRKTNKARTTDDFLKEKGFKLPLETIVEGIDKTGNHFSEKTTLSYISPSGSSFWLNTPIKDGSTLRLTIDLPPKLKENKDLKMIIKGKVIFIENISDQSYKSRVSLRFENKYIIDEYK